MKAIVKNLISGFLIAGFFGFLIWQYYKQPKVLDVQARQLITGTLYQGFTCDQPIPVGEATGNTQKLIKQIQDKYDETRVSLDYALGNINLALAALNENQAGVCNFAECAADVVNKAPDLTAEVQTGVTQPITISGHPAVCQTGEAKGDPCPDISELADKIGQQKAAIDSYRKQIKEIFEIATIPIPDDLKMGSDKSDTSQLFATRKGTLADLIVRQANYSEAWLTPAGETGWQTSCALTQADQARVARGEMGDVAPMRCRDALENGWYWPKASSPLCLGVCKDGGTEPCIKCLSNDPGPSGSTLAKVNYRIYGTCKNECKGELNSSCEACICKKQEDGAAMTYEECVDFLCGDRENYVCCHQKPLEIQYYIADDSDFETAGYVSLGARTISNVHMTAYAPPEFYIGKITKSGKKVGYGDIAVNRADMPLGAWVKITNLANQNGSPSNFFIDGQPFVGQNIYFCASDIGGGITEREMDLWLPSHAVADDFGSKTATIQWFYNPAEPCYKSDRETTYDSKAAFSINPSNFTISESVYGFESASGLNFQKGVSSQYNKASENLKALLSYLSGLTVDNQSISPNSWSISAITDKFVGTDDTRIANCANPSTNGQYACSHTANSCHYGGTNRVGESYAFDMSVKYPANNTASIVAQAACAWGRTNGVQVTAILEKTPTTHYHISVDNAIAGCDSNGARTDNICNFR